VTFRSTRVLTLDGEYLVVPNTQILSNRFSNHSTHPINRVTIQIGIAYKESISRTREVLLGLLKEESRVMKDPPPEVVCNALGASSVDLLFRFWIADESLERKL